MKEVEVQGHAEEEERILHTADMRPIMSVQ